MKTHHSTARLILMVFALALAGFSCKKSPNSIGNNLIDGENYIGVYHTDSLPVVCHSIVDSIGTKNVTYALLGSMKDPVFGTTDAGFYTQLHLSSTDHRYGNNPILDSLVLQLYLYDYYGDTMTMQTVHVYELTDTLSATASYYNYSEMPTDFTDHANSYQFAPRPKTAKVVLANDTVDRPLIRIPLSQELGNKIMYLDSTAYTNPDTFKEFFKGLYVTTETVNENGSVCYISLTNNTYSQLQLYYHEAETPNKSMRYDFYVTSNDVFFNRYIHDYTQGDAAFVDQVVNGNQALGQQTVYVQGMGGIKTFLKFPNLEHLADTLDGCHIIINEAKLVIPAQGLYEDTVTYKTPTNYYLVSLNNDGTNSILPDFSEGTTYYGGTYSSKTKSVFFRISEYAEDVILGVKPNNGLYLGINGSAYNAARWIIGGSEAEDKLHLEVTYSLVGE